MKNKNKERKKVDNVKTELLKERKALNKAYMGRLSNLNGFITAVFKFGIKVGRAGYTVNLKKAKP